MSKLYGSPDNLDLVKQPVWEKNKFLNSNQVYSVENNIVSYPFHRRDDE